MTRDRVVPLRGDREPVARRRSGGGVLGLRWRVQRDPDTRCPNLEGFHPDRPRAVVARLKVQTLPGYATTADLMVAAALWSDYDEGAEAVMAGDRQQEGETDG